MKTFRAAAATVLVIAGAATLMPAGAATPAPTIASFIVTTRGILPNEVAQLASALGGKVTFVYTSALKGFAISLPTSMVPIVRALPGVVAVERDRVINIASTQRNPPSYGLDRIDQRHLPLDRSYTTKASGSGVTAYIIDTGIRFSHRDFGGRASSGVDIIDGGRADDCNGHGTHVAGTLGGSTYGVAKAVKLIAVRVLDCKGSGSVSGVIAGVDWVTKNHVKGRAAVANMSLGGSTSKALDAAVNGAIDDGVSVAVAAGNDGNALLGGFTGSNNACNASPSRVPRALTVGATDRGDKRASYSDIGNCIDVFAPGDSITSDWFTSDTATNTISGTSMATPHVAGAAALYLSIAPQATPAKVQNRIVGSATVGAISQLGNSSPNRLLFVN